MLGQVIFSQSNQNPQSMATCAYIGFPLSVIAIQTFPENERIM